MEHQRFACSAAAECLCKNCSTYQMQKKIALVANVRRLFRTMFSLETDTNMDKEEIQWFGQNCQTVMQEFESEICLNSFYNYVHNIQHHAVSLLSRGGIGIYSNKIIETMNYLCKQMFLRLSNRGGDLGPEWTRLVIERHFMIRHLQIVDGDVRAMVRIVSDRKKLNALLKLIQ